MNQEILEYIQSQKVCVLAVEMLDGSPHAATVHFAHTSEPLQFFFETDSRYRKAEPLLEKPVTRASLVIGVDEDTMKTLQLDGEVRLLKTAAEHALYEKVYLGKFPNNKLKAADDTFLPFTFIPKWWRFTDWTGPDGKKITTSK